MKEIEDPIFKFNVGNIEYFLGNKAKAFQYFSESARLECNETQFLQGKMLYKSDGTKQSKYNIAIGINLIINAAKNENLNAMVYIYQMTHHINNTLYTDDLLIVPIDINTF